MSATKTNGTVSETILAIRAAAGNPCTTCPLCGQAPANPFRTYDAQGRITMGCIDATHDGHITDEVSLAWHNRNVACELRRQALYELQAVA